MPCSSDRNELRHETHRKPCAADSAHQQNQQRCGAARSLSGRHERGNEQAKCRAAQIGMNCGMKLTGNHAPPIALISRISSVAVPREASAVGMNAAMSKPNAVQLRSE